MGLGTAVVVALSQVNLETLRGNLLTILRDTTGLPVEITGDMSWKFTLRPRVELNQVRIKNADWAKHEYAFSAEKIDVTLNLISLFRPRPTIQNIRIYDATIAVEKNANGDYSVYPFNGREKNALDARDRGIAQNNTPPKYPFVDPGFGAVQIQNLIAHVLGETYSMSGISVRYNQHDENSREYSGWLRPDDKVYPFIISVSEYNSERKVYPVRIALSTGGDALIADVALEGTSKMPIDFLIRGDIPDVSAMARMFNLDLIELPPLTVNIAGGMEYHKLSLRKSTITMNGNSLTLSGSVDWAKDVPMVDLKLMSKSIKLLDIFTNMYKSDWVRPNRALHVFKDTPLFGGHFRGVNFNLDANIGNFIVYRDLNISKLNLNARVKDGMGRFNFKTVIAGGNIHSAGDVDISDDGHMDAHVAFRGAGISVGELLNQIGVGGFISDLPVDIDAYLVARGDTLDELMKTITGPVQVESSGTGYAHSGLVSYMYGTDFLTSLRHGIGDLFRDEKKYNRIKISCAALNVKLRDGVAETRQGAAVQTNAINLRMAGNVDLGNETMKLAITTVPVRGLKLSLTGNLVNSMEISGSLAEPNIAIDGAALAGRVASATGIGLLLAPFTGGLSLVAGAGVGLLAGDLLENWLADDKPCETAMERGASALRDDPKWLNLPVDELMNSVFYTNTGGMSAN